MSVKKFVNLAGFSSTFERQVVQRIATDIRNRARELVRVDKHDLQNSIVASFVGPGKAEVSSGGGQVGHATAQEFGRPDLNNYGFTPHMRPAAKEVLSRKREIIQEVADQAMRDNRI